MTDILELMCADCGQQIPSGDEHEGCVYKRVTRLECELRKLRGLLKAAGMVLAIPEDLGERR